MPVLKIRFLSGCYHATAWGRNVNEGEPEWPPSPFRIARALMDIWYRRNPEIPAHVVDQAFSALAETPRMSLPSVTTLVTKHYQDQGKKNGDRQPVVDAGVCMEHGESMYIELSSGISFETLKALEQLSSELNYLGRSESWVDVSIEDQLPSDRKWNCLPGGQVQVNTLLPSVLYDDMPYKPKTGKKEMTWLEAMALSTATLQAEGWNRHPLLVRSGYTIFEEKHEKIKKEYRGDGPICFTYALQAIPQPPVQRTLLIAERIRAGLMSRNRQITNDSTSISQSFSGKDAEGKPLTDHKHAFYWPCDLNEDGKIDHVKVILPAGVSQTERQALESLRKIWSGGSDIGKLILLHSLPAEKQEKAKSVISVTPVVFGRHYKPSKGSFDEWMKAEVSRCCNEIGLPEPISIEICPDLSCRDGAPIRWNEFICHRKKSAPAHGYGFKLKFDTPVSVPFAIGSLAHFGLGMFKICEP